MKTTKVTVMLPDHTLSQIEDIADKRGITRTEAIRYAISLCKYMDDEMAKGSRFYLHRGKSYARFLFPHHEK